MGSALAAPRCRRGFTLIEVLVVVIIVGLVSAGAVIAFAPSEEAPVNVSMTGDLETFAALESQLYHEHGKYDEPGEVLGNDRMALSPGVVVDSLAFAPDRVYLRVRHPASTHRCSVDLSSATRSARNRVLCFGGTARDSSEVIGLGEGGESPIPDTTSGVTRRPAVPTDVITAPAVADPPDVTVVPGGVVDRSFVVTNRSATARGYRLSFGSSDPTVVAPPADPPVATIPAGASISVRFRSVMAPGSAAGQLASIDLDVVDVADDGLAGRGTFGAMAAVNVVAPLVDSPAAVEVAPGETATVRWTVTSQSNVARLVDVTGTVPNGSLTLVAADGLGRVRFEPGETRTVVARYRLGSPSTAGTVQSVAIEATDAALKGLAGTGQALVTTALVVVPPDVSGAGDTVVAPGGSFTRIWTISSRSNAARSYAVIPEVRGGIVETFQVSGPSTVSVAEGGTSRIEVTYRVAPDAPAGSTSTLALVAKDEPGGVEGSASSRVTVAVMAVAPSVLAPPPASLFAGDSTMMVFRVRNMGNASRQVSLRATSSAVDVAAVSVPTGEIVVPAFDVRDVPVMVRFSWGPVNQLRAGVSLQAIDVVDPELSGSASAEVDRLNRAPGVTISGPGRDVVAGEAVAFSVTGNDPDGDGVRFELDLGDGITAVGSDVVHAYPAAGTYFVRARATDSFGLTGEDGLAIHVVAATLGCMDPSASNFSPSANLPGDCSYGPSLVRTELMVRVFICDYEQGFTLYQSQDTWARLYDFWSDGSRTAAGEAFQMSFVTVDLGPSGAAPYGLICDHYTDDWP